MTTSGVHAKHDWSAPATGVRWHSVRVALGVLSAGIGIYQMTAGHGVGASFSFAMAATFVLGDACERAIARARQDGAVVPTSLLILVGAAGGAMGGAIVLGVLVAMRGLS
jgi:hypothetical protein